MIPSKYYYDDDTKTQWNRKKQTKAQAKAAKKAKFDPKSKSTAVEVSKERSANAKPGLKAPTKESIKQRMEENEEDEDEDEDEADEDEDANEWVSESNTDDNDESQELEGGSEVEDTDINIVYDDEGNILEGEEEEEVKQKPKAKSQQNKPDPQRIQELRSQLASRIQELREKRKAPGTTVKGAPLNREAILEARREKQKLNKEKQLLKRKREEEEEEEDDDSEESGSEDEAKSGVMYSQVVFRDGERATADLKDIRKKKSTKGPRDILGQLKHIEKKKAKLESMDSEKRQDIEMKTKWSKALALAEGEKVRDDEKMLKKSLKRQTKEKKKSAKTWKERQQTVTKNIAEKQQKREENIALKRERNKLKSKKAKKRAGFEGRRKPSSKNKRAKKN